MIVDCFHRTTNLLGDCPIWSLAEQMLYEVDSRAPAIYRIDSADGIVQSCPVEGVIGSIAWSPDDRRSRGSALGRVHLRHCPWSYSPLSLESKDCRKRHSPDERPHRCLPGQEIYEPSSTSFRTLKHLEFAFVGLECAGSATNNSWHTAPAFDPFEPGLDPRWPTTDIGASERARPQHNKVAWL
jgi:hypothetical protein